MSTLKPRLFICLRHSCVVAFFVQTCLFLLVVIFYTTQYISRNAVFQKDSLELFFIKRRSCSEPLATISPPATLNSSVYSRNFSAKSDDETCVSKFLSEYTHYCEHALIPRPSNVPDLSDYTQSDGNISCLCPCIPAGLGK